MVNGSLLLMQWNVIQCLISIKQHFAPRYLGKFLCDWAKFHCCKWPIYNKNLSSILSHCLWPIGATTRAKVVENKCSVGAFLSSKLSHVVERCCHELEIDAVAASKQALEERKKERIDVRVHGTSSLFKVGNSHLLI